MISEAELEELRDFATTISGRAGGTIRHLAYEVEELRAALRDLVAAVKAYRPNRNGLGSELELWNAADKARAALGETT